MHLVYVSYLRIHDKQTAIIMWILILRYEGEETSGGIVKKRREKKRRSLSGSLSKLAMCTLLYGAQHSTEPSVHVLYGTRSDIWTDRETWAVRT